MSRQHTCADDLQRISDSDLKPTRSTVPQLAWWADREKAMATMASILGAQSLAGTSICYEHPTVVGGAGRGKASMTDVLLRYAGGAAAIEGKWTEPRYETVDEWRGDSANKKLVLGYWLSLIRPFCTGWHEMPSVVDGVVYQMIHRIASACRSAHDGQATLVYQVFEGRDHKHGDEYASDLREAATALRPGPRLRLVLIRVPIDVTDAWRAMQERSRCKGNAATVAGEIRRRIGECGSLFTFGPSIVSIV